MSSLPFNEMTCSLARTLGIIGDRWTPLVLRDIGLGISRFDTIQRNLGVSRRVLTERLAALVDEGIVAREAYQEHPPRYDYRLTEKGAELAVALVALQSWGDRWVFGEDMQPIVWRHLPCGQHLGAAGELLGLRRAAARRRGRSVPGPGRRLRPRHVGDPRRDRTPARAVRRLLAGLSGGFSPPANRPALVSGHDPGSHGDRRARRHRCYPPGGSLRGRSGGLRPHPRQAGVGQPDRQHEGPHGRRRDRGRGGTWGPGCRRHGRRVHGRDDRDLLGLRVRGQGLRIPRRLLGRVQRREAPHDAGVRRDRRGRPQRRGGRSPSSSSRR